MANRGIVKYEEAKDQQIGAWPERSYFIHLIDIILINLNERDSINRIASNPDNHTNKITQLSGINDKNVENSLNNTKTSVGTADTPLKAADMNVIINNTADLVRTVSPPTVTTSLINCPYYTQSKIVPTSYKPESGTATPITSKMTVNVKKYNKNNTYKKVYGFSTITAANMNSIIGCEIEPFGALSISDITYQFGNTTETVTIAALFTVQSYSDDSFTTTDASPVTYIVFNKTVDGLPESFLDMIITVNGYTFTANKSDLTDYGSVSACVINGMKDNISKVDDGATIDIGLVAEKDDESAVAIDARICTLQFNSSDSSTICENREIRNGYNLIRQTSPGHVQICTNTVRKITSNISTNDVPYSRPNATSNYSDGMIQTSSNAEDQSGNPYSGYMAIDGSNDTSWVCKESTGWWFWTIKTPFYLKGINIVSSCAGVMSGSIYLDKEKKTKIGDFSIEPKQSMWIIVSNEGMFISTLFIDITKTTNNTTPSIKNIEISGYASRAAGFNIPNVQVNEIVYASKWTEIAQYLRQVSSKLDEYKNWWDSNGYCARQCQTHCQSACQLSCQGCYSNTCHNQNCGFS